jgi:cytochrome c5
MTRILLLLSAFASASPPLGRAAAQTLELPPGPNRELVSHECQACHDLSMVLGAAGQDRAGWSATVDEMISYGLRVTPEEQAEIVDYLANSLGPPTGR